MSEPEVGTAAGIVRGTAADGMRSFLGIPYAAPPFGSLRMQPPAPVEPWDGVRDATAFGPTAPKGDYPPQYQPLLPEVSIPGEECLNLNVWTPDPMADALPVLVWIHGGSFMNGSGSVQAYDGGAFARDGVVCVTINYRLAADGFLFLDDGIANLGLQDQVAALRWVQDNIAAFGGDPTRVTVAGESAGAMSVTTLLAMPMADGLFAQAITQSGAAAHTLSAEEGLLVGRILAETLDVEPTREAIAAAPLEVLVKAASDLVVQVQSAPDPARWGRLALSLLPFAPVADGTVLPVLPLTAFAAGQGGDVALLTGSNRQESRLFLVAPGVLDHIDEATLRAGVAAYGLDDAGLQVYRDNRPAASPGDLLAAVVTDWFFAVPAMRVAEARSAGGASETWSYRFDHPDPADNHGLGACHAVEIPFVFDTIAQPGNLPLIGDRPSAQVAATTHDTWVRFITTGDPGWARYDTTSRTTGVLAATTEIVDDPAGEERRLWELIR